MSDTEPRCMSLSMFHQKTVSRTGPQVYPGLIIVSRGQVDKEMILLAFVISFVHGYIDCNDYYDIYDPTEPIACSLTQDTPVNRAKYTDIEHEIVITDRFVLTT